MTPDDIDTDDNSIEPVITSLVNFNAESAEYEYEAGFLLQGDYTVAFTCNADIEDIEDEEDLLFTGAQDVTVVAAEIAVADF